MGGTRGDAGGRGLTELAENRGVRVPRGSEGDGFHRNREEGGPGRAGEG
jgi:hypothetical protein